MATSPQTRTRRGTCPLTLRAVHVPPSRAHCASATSRTGAPLPRGRLPARRRPRASPRTRAVGLRGCSRARGRGGGPGAVPRPPRRRQPGGRGRGPGGAGISAAPRPSCAPPRATSGRGDVVTFPAWPRPPYKRPRGAHLRTSGGGDMELLRTIAAQPAGAKAGEQPGRAGGDPKRRRPSPAEEPPAAPQPRHHAGAEVSRVVVDPTTGRRYCRGRVLGKVRAPPPPPGSPLGRGPGAFRREGAWGAACAPAPPPAPAFLAYFCLFLTVPAAHRSARLSSVSALFPCRAASPNVTR